jgi:hypothetical protein
VARRGPLDLVALVIISNFCVLALAGGTQGLEHGALAAQPRSHF